MLYGPTCSAISTYQGKHVRMLICCTYLRLFVCLVPLQTRDRGVTSKYHERARTIRAEVERGLENVSWSYYGCSKPISDVEEDVLLEDDVSFCKIEKLFVDFTASGNCLVSGAELDSKTHSSFHQNCSRVSAKVIPHGSTFRCGGSRERSACVRTPEVF